MSFASHATQNFEWENCSFAYYVYKKEIICYKLQIQPKIKELDFIELNTLCITEHCTYKMTHAKKPPVSMRNPMLYIN